MDISISDWFFVTSFSILFVKQSQNNSKMLGTVFKTNDSCFTLHQI
jgi:hypothetical protein